MLCGRLGEGDEIWEMSDAEVREMSDAEMWEMRLGRLVMLR